MKIKTTTDINDYELPDCPDNLMQEMLEKEISANGTICRKCKWDTMCNKKWVAVDDLEVSRMYDKDKKPVWGINLNNSKELTEALYETKK